MSIKKMSTRYINGHPDRECGLSDCPCSLHSKTSATTSNIVSVMVMSGLIGLISSMLKTLEDRFSFSVSVLLHFAAVAVLVWLLHGLQ